MSNLNYAWKPHKTTIHAFDDLVKAQNGADTKSEVVEAIEGYVLYSIDSSARPQINDVEYLAVYSGIRHTTNRDTLGLASDRIPQDNTLDQTVSYLIAYIHEKSVGIPILIQELKDSIIQDSITNKYKISDDSLVWNTSQVWSARADRIVELMETARSKVGHLAADADFMRNWALVDLGEATGLELATSANPVQVGWIRHNTLRKEKMLFQSSTKLIQLKGLWQPPASREYRYYNNTDTATVTAKNGPSRIRVKTSPTAWGAWTVLAKDASRTFTKNEMRWDIESQPILVPTVVGNIPNMSLNVGVTESVDLENLFDGLRVTVTALSGDTDKVTVQVNQSHTSMGVVGVAAGKTTVIVSGTNEAGGVSVSFDVTVTEEA